ncbi:AAA family ATPase [Delftia sp. SD018]|uniref:AAA family ATPase n=1 Tax=unclassified Delftia TaxID=2613839 RepID=UPI001A96544D|nr:MULTISPECIES: AAA family ATPase [unclassified Delftia]MBO0989868.1 AAA family ATPase [Delftia sp. SD083]MBO1037098.1 AAA family ATPase [Delftia sp. SD018]
MVTVQIENLEELAARFRRTLDSKSAKKFIILYAYNGTGKTRLSGIFKDLGKKINKDGETKHRDTLYFNAFTEDLFSWYNDLDNDSERYLTLHPTSRFFAGLEELEMDNRIGPILSRYTDFEFKLDKAPLNNSLGESIGEQHIVRFFRTFITPSGKVEVNNIKISRSEENIFLWCFFLAIVQLVLDGDKNYQWVKYVYIDDPISSLDENNAIAVASHLAHLLTKARNTPKTVISTHHTLFFNVLCNEIGKGKSSRFFLKNDATSDDYLLSDTDNKPFLHHLATLAELKKVTQSGEIKRHHFNMMRCIMEQTAIFCGLDGWTACIKVPENDPDRDLHERMINVMSHADYLINEPHDPPDRYKDDFRNIFEKFASSHFFSAALYSEATKADLPLKRSKEKSEKQGPEKLEIKTPVI